MFNWSQLEPRFGELAGERSAVKPLVRTSGEEQSGEALWGIRGNGELCSSEALQLP